MMENTLVKEKGLSGSIIKYIAIFAMLIDHIAWAFVPLDSVLGQIMHIIGRITAPTMCFFIAEGYYHTGSIKKYALRLGLFALISHCPFIIFEYGKPFVGYRITSVFYTLFLGLIALWIWDKIQNKALKITAVILICIIAEPGDWSYTGVLWVLAFGINHSDFKKQIKWFGIISLIMVAFSSLQSLEYNGSWYGQLFQLGVFLAIPVLLFYNGQRGKGGRFGKWFFYIFYPMHLLIIGILKFYVFKL